MIWFFLCVGLLVAGYFIYGKFIEQIFGPKPERATPAITMADGVDYVPMSDKKVYLVQLLNIAGVEHRFELVVGREHLAVAGKVEPAPCDAGGRRPAAGCLHDRAVQAEIAVAQA